MAERKRSEDRSSRQGKGAGSSAKGGRSGQAGQPSRSGGGRGGRSQDSTSGPRPHKPRGEQKSRDAKTTPDPFKQPFPARFPAPNKPRDEPKAKAQATPAEEFSPEAEATSELRHESSEHKKSPPQDENLVAGRKVVLEFLSHQAAQVDTVYLLNEKNNSEVQRIVDACRAENIRFTFVPRQQLDKLYAGPHHGCVARLFAPGFWDEESLLEAGAAAHFPLILALDQLQDAGNAGTLARTLFGLGGGGLLMPKHNAAYLGAGAVRASAGALYRLPIARATNLGRSLEWAADKGYTLYTATLAPEGEDVFSLTPRFPAILVLGNEEKGVRPGVASHCTPLRIPLTGTIDSLNVAQAGALIMGLFYSALAAKKR